MEFNQLKIRIRTLLRSSALFLLASNSCFSATGFVDAALASTAQKSSKEIKNIVKRAEISTNYTNGSLRLVS